MAERDLTFIPKKSLTPNLYQKRGTSPLIIISIFLAIASALIAAGFYFYKNKINKETEGLRESVNRAQLTVDEVTINNLENMTEKIKNAKEIVDSHKSLIPLFNLLESTTLKSIRFSNFSYSESGENISVKMDGEANSYSSLANQSDSYTKNNDIKNFVFSNLTLTDKGNIKFSIDIQINPSLVLYSNKIKNK